MILFLVRKLVNAFTFQIDTKLVKPDWVELSTEAGKFLPMVHFSLVGSEGPDPYIGILRTAASAIDIGFHAIPAAVLTIDLLYLSPPWSIGALPSMGLASVIAFGYWFWVEKCYQYNGWYAYIWIHIQHLLKLYIVQSQLADSYTDRYPYPIFEKLTTGWRIVLFLFSAIMMAMNTLVLKHLYVRINGFLHPTSDTHSGALKRA